LQAGTVITEGFTNQDLIGIMDETFACLVSIYLMALCEHYTDDEHATIFVLPCILYMSDSIYCHFWVESLLISIARLGMTPLEEWNWLGYCTELLQFVATGDLIEHHW